MLAALATIAFLMTLCLIGTVALRMIEESGGKIVAALKGQSCIASPQSAPVAVRLRSRAATQQRPVRVRPTLRAVA